MRLVLPYSLLTLTLLATAWITWPTHPADLFSCEIARLTGTEEEADIKRCVQALNPGKSEKHDDVFIHRQATLINASLPQPRFVQSSTEFKGKVDARHAEYDLSVVIHAAALLGPLLMTAIAIVTLIARRKQKSTPISVR